MLSDISNELKVFVIKSKSTKRRQNVMEVQAHTISCISCNVETYFVKSEKNFFFWFECVLFKSRHRFHFVPIETKSIPQQFDTWDCLEKIYVVVSLKNVFHHGQDFHTTTQKWEAKVYGENNKEW